MGKIVPLSGKVEAKSSVMGKLIVESIKKNKRVRLVSILVSLILIVAGILLNFFCKGWIGTAILAVVGVVWIFISIDVLPPISEKTIK